MIRPYYIELINASSKCKSFSYNELPKKKKKKYSYGIRLNEQHAVWSFLVTNQSQIISNLSPLLLYTNPKSLPSSLPLPQLPPLWLCDPVLPMNWLPSPAHLLLSFYYLLLIYQYMVLPLPLVLLWHNIADALGLQHL